MTIQSIFRALPVLLATGSFPSLWATDAPIAADTYISAGSPAANFGTAVNLSIAPGNSGLVLFDLSSFPSGTTVPVAYLRIFANTVTTGGTLTFSQVTSPWAEGSVTFATAPTTASPFTSIPVSTGKSFLLVDVTALVNGWLANPATNFGIQISGSGSTTVLVDSKENLTTSHPAAVEVTVVALRDLPGRPGQQALPDQPAQLDLRDRKVQLVRQERLDRPGPRARPERKARQGWREQPAPPGQPGP